MQTVQNTTTFRTAVLSVVKHSYVPLGVASHPRFELVVVADDDSQPEWVHERNSLFADQIGIPYVRDVQRALADYDVQVAVVSSEAERHCDLSVRAAQAGLHVVQDKPMSTKLSECDRLVEAIQANQVKFLLWNRNHLPALIEARRAIQDGAIGQPYAMHLDFYFSKDAGPPKGSRNPGDAPINWLQRQRDAHADGSDGGVGVQPMGELQIEGIYPLAYLHMLSGWEVERVYTHTAARFHQANVDNEVDDLASVTLEMKGGFLGTLAIGRIGAASHPDIGEIKVHILGTRGALVISEARPEVSVYYRGQPAAEFRNIRVANDNDYQLMDNFARAIDGNGETDLDAPTGRTITAVVEAAIESGRTGKPVDVG